jgi:ComF family protein
MLDILSLGQKIGNLLLPRMCILCCYPTQRTTNLCQPCEAELPILTHNCPRCAHFLATEEGPYLCGQCLKKPPPFAATYALFTYTPPITKLILGLKFRKKLVYAAMFSELFYQRITQHWYHSQPLPDLILPVPLHKQRLQERGFNQALEIAKPLAKKLGIPVAKKGLQRIKHTVPQAVLPASARQENVQHAFQVTADFCGLNIAVLDDVMTTGHTLTACCLELKKCGVKSIHIWCCARRSC